MKGNTLVLFSLIKHGKELYNLIEGGKHGCYLVYGATDTETREDVRRLAEKETGIIIIASFGVFSTGVNIRNLHNIIFASPSKSRIRNLQSIGRGLRKSDTKSTASLYDIADDLSFKERKNYTLNHFMERVKIYSSEQFPYHIYTIPIKG